MLFLPRLDMVVLATCETSLRFRSGLQERERRGSEVLPPAPVPAGSQRAKKVLNLGRKKGAVRPPWIKTNE